MQSKDTTYNSVKEHLLNKLKKNEIRIPVLPEVAGKIISLVNSPELKIDKIVEFLEKDPIIAGHILRVANSPAFSSSVRIKDLKQASIRIGTKLLTEITLSVSLQSGVFIINGYHQIIKDILKHTLATALFTKELYGLIDADINTTYLAALFHTCGMPAILYHILEYKRVNKIEIDDKVVNLMLLEFQIAYTNEVLKKWNQEKELIYICSNYLKYQTIDELTNECGLIYLSKKLSVWLFTTGDTIDPKKFTELKYLNIHPDNLDSLINNKEWILQKVKDMTEY